MRDDRSMGLAVMALAASVMMGGALAFPAPAACAQDAQNQSVADAARQAREQKKNASKPSKVISDDDIDARSVKPGAEGLNGGTQPKTDAQPPSPAAVSAVEAVDAASAAAEKNPPVKAGDDPEIAKVKEQVTEANAALDLLKRSFALDQDTYFSKPSYSDDHEGKSKLDAEQLQINDKQQEVDHLKALVAELEQRRKNKTGSTQDNPSDVGTPDAATPSRAVPSAPQK
jgi:hypothetical protein